MASLFSGAYINEIEKRSYPIGTPSKGYDAMGKVIPAQSSFLAENPAAVVTPPVNPPVTRSKYINPATGEYFKTAEEYGNYVATKIPVASDVPKYAGDAMTNPDASAADLTRQATGLNNARNDIAVGAADPYKVGNQSGIAYSPQELKAIEKAYAGVYDPALNDVFARLKVREEEKKAEQRKQEQIFATNENIRQWQATTGSKGGGTSDIFSDTQIGDGASAAGLTLSDFQRLDDNVKNLYVNPPMVMGPEDKPITLYKSIANDILDGVSSEAIINKINNSNISQVVKDYLIKQVPANAAAKSESGWAHYWSEIGGDIAKGDILGAAGSLFGQ